MDTSKKTTVKLLTFQTWNLAYFGCKSELKKGVAHVSQVWCKACVQSRELISTLCHQGCNKSNYRMFLWWNRLHYRTVGADTWQPVFLQELKEIISFWMLIKTNFFEQTIWFYENKKYKEIRTLFSQIFRMIRIVQDFQGLFL